MNEDVQKLKTFLATHISCSDAIWEEVLAAWEPYEAKRKTLISSAGERESYIYFVVQGIQRIYYLGPQAKEVTLIFTYAPSFSGIVNAFLDQQVSKYYLETLSHSRFLRISYDRFMDLCKRHEVINDMVYRLAAFTIDGLLYRMAELQAKNAEQKFKALLTRSPHLLNLIPHKYLASYLGIDPTTFSKLLGRVRIS